MGFKMIYWTPERFILFIGFKFGKMWKFLETRPFFRADMAILSRVVPVTS